jgi:hypothetical protein
VAVAAEELTRRDEGESQRGHGEGLGEFPAEEGRRPGFAGGRGFGEFKEALFLAPIGEDDADAPLVASPLLELIEEALAPGLLENEVAGLEAAEGRGEAGGRKVLLAPVVDGCLGDSHRRLGVIEADDQVAGLPEIADLTVGLGFLEQELGRLEFLQ